ncbi:MAG TPA: hypothetical protein VFT50_12215 [Baekduia sp.]|nr:hypothetical protein [Baekduia sp.]
MSESDDLSPAEHGVRPDPRKRPPDPAGTQPQWSDVDLLPRHRGTSAPGSLWGPPGPPSHEDGAEGAADHERVPPAAVAASAPDEPEADARESRFSPRFQFALGALMAVAAAAVVLFVAVIAGRSDRGMAVVHEGPSWSAWHPNAASDGPTQIADHVGHQYRLPDGRQLVAVTGGPLQIAGLPVTVAVRETPAQGGEIKLIDGSGVLYRMCGLGPKCSIDEGKASTQRHLLLRREALELALYSFRYLGVSETTVFLPPRKGQDPSQALFFRRGDADLQGPVTQPLDDTLTARTPTVRSITRSPDAELVNTITLRKLFKVSFTQANQDARAFMVLEPLQ